MQLSPNLLSFKIISEISNAVIFFYRQYLKIIIIFKKKFKFLTPKSLISGARRPVPEIPAK